MLDIICVALGALAVVCFLLWVYIQNEVDKRYNNKAKELDNKAKQIEEKFANLAAIEKEIEYKYDEKYKSAVNELKQTEQHNAYLYRKKYNSLYNIRSEELEKKYQSRHEALERYYIAKTEQHKADFDKLIESSQTAFPWLAGMVNDYRFVDLERAKEKLSESLSIRMADKYTKITVLTKQLKETTFQYHTLKYQLEYLFALYPELQYVIDSDISDLPSYKPEDENDPIRNYLSEAEYSALSEDERNQRALDVYIASHQKTSWQIGRDYELYVGYRMRSNQFDVKQTGISDKFEDLGRDIIAVKNGIHYIVQCKYWSADKVIREKHIAQLYGTCVCYALENNLPLDKVRCVFYTNIDYSDMAKQFANALSVKLIDHFDIGEYPRIKCKVNYDEHGKTYIYHLPMDQQYDTAVITPDKGDMYAFTVEEAVSHGFRRAYRWHGN